MGGRAMLLQLLLLVLLVAKVGSSIPSTECSSIYDHVVNTEGAIKFPVFHRNHPCLRLMKRTSSEQIEAERSTTIDVIEDSTINDFLFLMPIMLGTPPIMNLVAINTGSTLSWVQCQPCKPRCHSQSSLAGQVFDPSKSSTFQRSSCKSRECLTIKYALRLYFKNCMEIEDTCLYSMTYGGGWAYTAGKVVSDKITIGNEQDMTINFSLLFGCSLDTEYSHQEAGIIGSGNSSFSFFDQVSKLISYKSFSYCLPFDETYKGYMVLGNYNRQVVDGYTPLFPSSQRPTYSLIIVVLVANGQNLVSTASEMVVDSGSFWTLLFPSTFNLLDDTIAQAMEPLNYSRSYSRGSSYICFISRSDSLNFKGRHTVFNNWSILPTMKMSFAGGSVTLPLSSKHLFHNNAIHGLCMNFMKSGNDVGIQVLGNRMTRSFETIFDIQGKKFGFRYGSTVC